MGARDELNKVHLYTAFGVAVVLGLVTGSWVFFALTFAVMVGASLYVGEIRPRRSRRR